MAQELIRRVVADLQSVLEMPDPVYDFGSLLVEADQDGDLRPLFAGRAFTGVDMRPGPGVDVVADLRALPLDDGSVGTALCLDTLEHCEDPVQACRELARVCDPARGVCVISSVMLFGIHAYPSDYFRFTPEAFRSMLGGFDHAWAFGTGDPGIPSQVIGVGLNGAAPAGFDLAALPSLRDFQHHYDGAAGRVVIGPFRFRPSELLVPLARQAPRLVRERLRRR